LALQFRGDLARSVWSGTEFRHRTEVLLLKRSQPIEADAKEVLIEGGNCGNRSGFDIL